MNTKISQVVTEVFSPFVLSGLLLCHIAVVTDPRWEVSVLACLIFIVGLPLGLSLWMHRTGRTTDRFIQQRQQRMPFYAGTLVSYLAGVALLNLVGTSRQVLLALNLSVNALVVVALINLKIKVSVHALAAALFALVFPLYTPWPVAAYLLGVLIWGSTVYARWQLRRHTVVELALGTLCGGLLAVAYLALR